MVNTLIRQDTSYVMKSDVQSICPCVYGRPEDYTFGYTGSNAIFLQRRKYSHTIFRQNFLAKNSLSPLNSLATLLVPLIHLHLRPSNSRRQDNSYNYIRYISHNDVAAASSWYIIATLPFCCRHAAMSCGHAVYRYKFSTYSLEG